MENEQSEENEKKKLSITFVPSKVTLAQIEAIKLPDRNSPSPTPVTDHFLQIVPKPTLLGKQQAKKRLKAFAKTNAITNSPVKVKVLKTIKSVELPEEKFDEHGVKVQEMTVSKKPSKDSGSTHDDTAKKIVEEIENIKKIENKMFQAALQRSRKSRTRSRSRERRHKHRRKEKIRRSNEKLEKEHSDKESFKYPENWVELKEKNLTFDKLKYMDIKKNRHIRLPSPQDSIKMLRFKAPPLVFTPLKFKRVNGQEEFVPPQFIRYTSKSSKISYSINHTRAKNLYFNREQVLNTVSKNQRESIEEIISQAGRPLIPPLPLKVRNWFPKLFLTGQNVECELLQPSLGLSILQNYSDEEKTDKKPAKHKKKKEVSKNDSAELIENSRHKLKNESRKTKTKFKNKKVLAKKVKRRKKRKRKEEPVSDSSSDSQFESKKHKKKKTEKKSGKFIEKCTDSPCDTLLADLPKKFTNRQPIIDFNDFGDVSHKEKSNERNDSELQVTKENVIVFDSTEIQIENNLYKESSVSVDDHSIEKDETSQKSNENSSNEILEGYKEKNESSKPQIDLESIILPSHNKEITIKTEPADSESTSENNSHWESEDEAPKIPQNNSWESDEEEYIFKPVERPKLSGIKPSERSLEMPLNINFGRSRDSIKNVDNPHVIQTDANIVNSTLKGFEDLEKAKRTLSEEKKRLELEKQKIAAMEEKIAWSEKNCKQLVKIKQEIQEPSQIRTKPTRWEENIPNNIPIKQEEENDVPLKVLEDEYEQFMKAVSSNDLEESAQSPKYSRKRKYSTSSTDSSSSSDSSSDTSSSSTDVRDDETSQPPLPVPSPGVTLQERKVTTIYGKNLVYGEKESPTICKVDSTSSPNKNQDIDLDNRKRIPTIVLQTPIPVLDNSIFKDSDEEKFNKEGVGSGQSSKLKVSQRRSSPRRQSHGVRRRESFPRRRDYSPKCRRRYSPSRHRYSSPKRNRDYSPRYSPRRHHSISPHDRHSVSPPDSFKQKLTRMAYETSSKSPNDGFITSLADSTISDDQLLQNQDSYSESSVYYTTSLRVDPPSPKRIPLDDRISQVLGTEKEEPKPITTTYAQNYNTYNQQGYYDQYSNYAMEYDNSSYKHFNPSSDPPHPTSKVVQVGNMLQVVPTEEPVPFVPPVKKLQTIENTQKIVQVGNMLQIVPTPNLPVETVIEPVPVSKEKQSAEELMRIKVAERKAEREKRRQERDKRRKEKEKKRKERENRRQIKIKQKTEEILKILLIEAENEEFEEFADDNVIPPPIISVGSKPAGRGILVSRKESDRPKKGVKFADGIIPGEGTSPSGGEELSSPPPVSLKLPKEKRFTKTKKPKKIKPPKKKVKVKIIRKSDSADIDEEDTLPPPSPPPGSPPPHIFPSRVKPTNNVNQNYIPSSPQINFPYNQSNINCRPDFAQPPPQIGQTTQLVPHQLGPAPLPINQSQLQPPLQQPPPMQLGQPPPQIAIPHHIPRPIHVIQNHPGTSQQLLPGTPQHHLTPPQHRGTPPLHSGTTLHHSSSTGHPHSGTPQHHSSAVSQQQAALNRHHQSKPQFITSISAPQSGSQHHHGLH